MVVLRALWNHCQVQSWVHCPSWLWFPWEAKLDWLNWNWNHQIPTHQWPTLLLASDFCNVCSLSVQGVDGRLSWCFISVTQGLKIYLGGSCCTAKPRSGFKLQSFKDLSGSGGVGPVCYLVARELFWMLLLVFLKLSQKCCQKQDFTFHQGYPGLLCG